MSARACAVIVALGAALVPASASGASLTHAPPVAHAAQDQSGELSPTPPVTLNNGNSNSSSSSSGTPAASPLPDTGADLPTTALIGLGLLVSGIGLRMRTVDERIF